MAETGEEINVPKTTQNLKSSLLGVIIKAQSSLSPTRKSDSSLIKIRESSKESENQLSQRLWFSLKRLSISATDFSKHAPINWTTYFSSSSPSSGCPATAESKATGRSALTALENETEGETVENSPENTNPNSTTCDSFTSMDSFSMCSQLRTEQEREEAYCDQEIATVTATAMASGRTTDVKQRSLYGNGNGASIFVSNSVSSSLSSDTERLSLSTTWLVTPATPETISAGTPTEESPLFDWSNFDWKEGESNPPRGLLFPFPIRPLSRTESCHSILMGNTGSNAEFEL